MKILQFLQSRIKTDSEETPSMIVELIQSSIIAPPMWSVTIKVEFVKFDIERSEPLQLPDARFMISPSMSFITGSGFVAATSPPPSVFSTFFLSHEYRGVFLKDNEKAEITFST